MKISEQQAARSGIILLLLFCLSIYTSKSGVNIAGGLLLIWFCCCAAAHPGCRRALKERYVWIFLLPFAMGICTSFFSPPGLENVLRFIREYRFWLLILPFAAFVRRPEDFEKMLVVLNLSALAAFIYGVISVWPDIWLNKVPVSFLAVGRQADLNFTLILANSVAMAKYDFVSFKRSKLIKPFLGLNTLLLLYMLLGLKMAAAWLGLCTGILFFTLFYFRRLLIFLVSGAVLLSLFLPATIKKEAATVLDFENCYSTVTRIQLYRTGIDFLLAENLYLTGTGVKNAKGKYQAFMEKQPRQYQNENIIAFKTCPGNFHNSFLQMAVESGVLFLIVYLLSVFYLFAWMMKTVKQADAKRQSLIITALTSTVGFLVSQFFHGGLYDYASLAFYLFFFWGCYGAHPDPPLDRLQKKGK